MTVGALIIVSMGAAIGVGWWAFRGVRGAVAVSIIAVLAMAASAARVLLAGLPGVEPVTGFVVVTVAVLGVRCGAAVGCVAVLASNAVLGHGPWTPWQILGYALVAVLAAVLRRNGQPGRTAIAVVAIGAAACYDLVLIASQPAVLGLAELSWADYQAYAIVGVPLTLLHMAGAGVVAWIIARPLTAALERAALRLAPLPSPVIRGIG